MLFLLPIIFSSAILTFYPIILPNVPIIPSISLILVCTSYKCMRTAATSAIIAK